MKNLEIRKQEVLANYKEAKANYLKNKTNENWVTFCNCKSACMALGVRI